MIATGWARGITDIVEVPDLGSTPAAVDRETGIVYVSEKWKNRLSKDQWMFILLHEMGHLELRSTDEEEVDNWAFNEYANRGYSLNQSVKSLTRILNFNNPEHIRRANLQLARAEAFDRSKLKYSGMDQMDDNTKRMIQAGIGLAGSILGVIFLPKVTGKSGIGWGVLHWILGGIVFGLIAVAIFKEDFKFNNQNQ